jgi:hypothetical protein
VILVVFAVPMALGKTFFSFSPFPQKLTFFGFLTGVAATNFQTNFCPEIWQCCTLGSSPMCSASHCIFGFSEIYSHGSHNSFTGQTAFCEFLEKGHGPWAKGTWARPFWGKKGTGTGT